MNTSWTCITFGCSSCSSFMRFREFSFARIPRFCQHHRCLWSNAFQSPISQQHVSLSAQCIFSHDCFPKFGVTELFLPVLGCQYPYLLVAISSMSVHGTMRTTGAGWLTMVPVATIDEGLRLAEWPWPNCCDIMSQMRRSINVMWRVGGFSMQHCKELLCSPCFYRCSPAAGNFYKVVPSWAKLVYIEQTENDCMWL